MIVFIFWLFSLLAIPKSLFSEITVNVISATSGFALISENPVTEIVLSLSSSFIRLNTEKAKKIIKTPIKIFVKFLKV